MDEFVVKIKPVTPIWTGDENRKNTTLRETEILGSLRWWYEALIRGLGGTACDPTKTKCEEKKHCDACELFGCTGWARKFRLEAIKLYDNSINLKFIKMRKMEDVEWALLQKVLIVISKYGALGGKIAESQFGVIQIEKTNLSKVTLNKEDINKYLKKNMITTEDNPTLSRFVFINENLTNETVTNIKQEFPFLKGQEENGKRYFYKTDNNNKPLRFFAYAENNKEYEKIVGYLENQELNFIKGRELLEDLL